MKLTKEQLRKIIAEEIGQMTEAGLYGLGPQRSDSSFSELPDEPEDDYSREMRHRAAHGMGDPPTTLEASESANDLRTAIAQFVAENPQLADPKVTIIAIVSEIIK